MDEGGNALVLLSLCRQGARRGSNGGTVLRDRFNLSRGPYVWPPLPSLRVPLPERLPFTKFLIYRNYI